MCHRQVSVTGFQTKCKMVSNRVSDYIIPKITFFISEFDFRDFMIDFQKMVSKIVQSFSIPKLFNSFKS